MTAWAITWSYLRARPLTAGLYTLILAMGVAAATALLLFSSQSERRLQRDARPVDVVVGSKASSPLQLVMAGVFHIDNPPPNIPVAAVERLRADPRVETAIPLALGDSAGGFRIVGAPADIVSLYDARMAEGEPYAESFEAVLGAAAARGLGLGVGDSFVGAHGVGEGGHAHDDHAYQITGVLAPTGSVLDRLILTPVASVWDVHGIDASDPGTGSEHTGAHAHGHDLGHDHGHDYGPEITEPAQSQGGIFANRGRVEAPPPEVTMVLIGLRSPLGAESLLRDLNAGPDLLAARPASEAIRLYSLMGLGGRVLQAFAFILIGAAAASVFVTLFATLRERRGEVALLRAMGATRATVFGVLLGQGLAIAAAGTGLGLVGGHGLIAFLAHTNAQAAAFGLSGALVHPGEIFIALGGLAAGALAALPAAIGAYRTDIAKTLAETG
jgi:putative ABC transport system permease protein